MSKTIAYDLGTNSIGWSIREDQKEGNQIVNAGVITFNKGVGEEKNIEYSLAASRTGIKPVGNFRRMKALESVAV